MIAVSLILKWRQCYGWIEILVIIWKLNDVSCRLKSDNVTSIKRCYIIASIYQIDLNLSRKQIIKYFICNIASWLICTIEEYITKQNRRSMSLVFNAFDLRYITCIHNDFFRFLYFSKFFGEYNRCTVCANKVMTLTLHML